MMANRKKGARVDAQDLVTEAGYKVLEAGRRNYGFRRVFRRLRQGNLKNTSSMGERKEFSCGMLIVQMFNNDICHALRVD